MAKPTFTDYVNLLFILFERFWQYHAARSYRGRPFVYQHKALIVLFVIMQQRRLFHFKTQRRWLARHPEVGQALGFNQTPHRTTLSRRYKALYRVVQDLIAFVGHYGERPRPPLYLQGPLHRQEPVQGPRSCVAPERPPSRAYPWQPAPPPGPRCLLEQKRLPRLGLWLRSTLGRQSRRVCQVDTG